MYDCFNRKINYLRISVTDRCNLRCTYCMPEKGVELLPQSHILSFDEICQTISHGVSHGIDKIRITGGEPLVRNGIVDLVKQISKIKGIKDLAMTTNGIELPKYAQELKEAGLNRVNISLDTTDPLKYKTITRNGNINAAFKGITAAKEAGLFPIKINCVIKKSMNEPDAQLASKFAKDNDLDIRYIYEMKLAAGEFHSVEGGEGGNCISCNRLRLTSNGIIKPCLFNDIGYNIREIGIKKAFQLALNNKPESGTTNSNGEFYNIGG